MQFFLLDTHIFLWWLIDSPDLPVSIRDIIIKPKNQIFISAATTWEISIKQSLGKLEAPEDLDAIVEKESFSKLPISLYHGQIAGKLPSFHRDPFDRMLIAQAQAEGLFLVTTDLKICKYEVQVITS